VNLKKAADLKLIVTDLIGKTVYSESRNSMQPGNHSLSINTSGFEPGVYFYTVATNNQKTTKCMIVQ
jgi:hypothetical protein